MGWNKHLQLWDRVVRKHQSKVYLDGSLMSGWELLYLDSFCNTNKLLAYFYAQNREIPF